MLLAALVSTPIDAAPAPNTSAPAEHQRLSAFLDRAFDERTALSPQSLTALGLKQAYARLDDYSDAAPLKALALAQKQLEQMREQFRPEALSPAERLSYRLFEMEVERQRIASNWRFHFYPVTNLTNPAALIPAFLMNQHQIDTLEDAQAYISRLSDVERVMREVSESLKIRAGMGIIAPRLSFQPVMADTRRVLTGAPFDAGGDSALLADFRRKLAKLEVPAGTSERLIVQANGALSGPFKLGYEQLLDTLKTLEAQAKGNDGVWSLPNGVNYYADAVRLSTTVELTPDQIHEIGLAEVTRIQHAMEQIKQAVKFDGSLPEFFAYIKNDPRFHYPDTDAGRQAYLNDAKALIEKAMQKAPLMFRASPKAALEVRAVEPWRAETAATAFYERPAPNGSRPGIYYVNLADMSQVLKPQVEAIAYHEGAPGHHFQLAFAQELEELPKFRRFGMYGAYVEGWGLYAEQLGKELGFYEDPYSEFGRLSLELWRAIRLVADTGLHARRWTREHAIDYFKKNTLLSDRDIVKEVDRYLVWPGQATSYKVGHLEILRLRAKAQAGLGDAFDVRDFHAVILGSGALPLEVLADQVDAYIEEKSSD